MPVAEEFTIKLFAFGVVLLYQNVVAILLEVVVQFDWLAVAVYWPLPWIDRQLIDQFHELSIDQVSVWPEIVTLIVYHGVPVPAIVIFEVLVYTEPETGEVMLGPVNLQFDHAWILSSIQSSVVAYILNSNNLGGNINCHQVTGILIFNLVYPAIQIGKEFGDVVAHQ